MSPCKLLRFMCNHEAAFSWSQWSIVLAQYGFSWLVRGWGIPLTALLSAMINGQYHGMNLGLSIYCICGEIFPSTIQPPLKTQAGRLPISGPWPYLTAGLEIQRRSCLLVPRDPAPIEEDQWGTAGRESQHVQHHPHVHTCT